MSPYMMLLQVGSNTNNSYYVELFNTTTKGLEIEGLEINTIESTQNAIDKVEQAIEKVSSARGKFGAYNNGLEHLLSNTNNTNYNLISSESRILDCDMAKETMALVKLAILENASMAMLNQSKVKSKEVLMLIKHMIA
ncbi:Flagellin [bioreactor metagenome]|uniref:Flagellin n=1 Tax=bioreactor metagenome TaxID=1076179 RepID=A0A645INK1_9ZZZZ